METDSETFSLNRVRRSSSCSSSSTLNAGNNNDNTDIICCPCDDDDDDGFTIQCEQCLTWQHGKCMNISPARVPRYHICNSCQASSRRRYLRQTDGQGRYGHSKQKHRQQQQQQPASDNSGNSGMEVLENQANIRNNNDNDKIISRDISTNAHTTTIDSKGNNGNSYRYGDNRFDDESTRSTKYDYDLGVDPLVKHESAPDTSHFIKLDTSPSATPFNKNQQTKRKESTDALNNGDILKKRMKKKTKSGNKDLEDDDDDDDDDDGNNYDDDDETVTPYDYSANTTASTTPKSRRNSSGTRSSRSSGRFVQVFRNIIKNKLVKQTMKEAREQWKSSNDEMSTVVSLDASVLLPSIPKVSVRSLWKSLLGGNTSSTRGKNDPSVRKGVFAEIHVPENRFLMEINGEISIKSAYKCDLGSLYPLLHTPEDHLFFYPSLDLMIDARSYGNDSRYIRRSCHPNAQVKCITVVSHSKDDDKGDDQTVHLGLFTLEEVDKGEELSIAWDWQRGTSLWKKYTQWKRQQQHQSQSTPATFADPQVELMLDSFEKEFGECACQDKDECFVVYMKDICQSASSANNISNSNKKGAQQLRRQQLCITGDKDTRSNGTGQRRRSKDSPPPQPPRSTQSVPNQKQKILSRDSSKTIGKTKRHRSSKSNTSIDLTMINMNAKNDIFFASLPTSRATSPVHNAKSLPSSTEKHGTATAPTMATTTVVGISCDTINLNKKWVSSSRLPCKKAWMKTYLAEIDKTRAAPVTSSSNLNSKAIDGFWDEIDTNMDRDGQGNKIPYLEGKHQHGSINEAIDNEATTSVMDDLVMDESMGDDSSTATLPLDSSNDRMTIDDHHDSYSGFDKFTKNATTAAATTTSTTTTATTTTNTTTSAATNVTTSKHDHHATFQATGIPSPTTTSSYSVIKVSPSHTDNHSMGIDAITSPPPLPPSPPKPAKAKLSLQEYLSMRKKHD